MISKKEKIYNLLKIIGINLLIFTIANIVFYLKYEQVDDFIIYNLYSGLDGTHNFFGVYIHPFLCAIIGLFFKIVPSINWHTIFLLNMQFICFTIIGYIITKKNKNIITTILYTCFASIFYIALLLLIQYTSVAALLIGTALFIIIDQLENKKHSKMWLIISIILFSIGIMTRMQSLLIIVPFYTLYAIVYLIRYRKKQIEFSKFIYLIKIYLLFICVTVVIYISNYLIYNYNQTYREYNEYNKLRTVLHDLSYTKYEENKQIFDEIGWSKNDHDLFYTFNFGDENVYSKENLQKIIDYKIEKNEYYNLNLNLKSIISELINDMIYTNPYISILFFTIFILSIFNGKKGITLGIFLATLGTNLIFVILNRCMLRVVLPEYLLGTAFLIYNFDKSVSKDKERKEINAIITILVATISICFGASTYKYNYNLKNYKQYKELINYTNEHKENAYLYTVPSLQYRYLAYSVYEMPPKESFSNLRVMGGWDMFTQNYYNFKQRYLLDGTMLDVLKENVYVIDGDVTWSGNRYKNYINNIVLFIKENYNIDVTYEKIQEFNNLYIYKMNIKQ